MDPLLHSPIINFHFLHQQINKKLKNSYFCSKLKLNGNLVIWSLLPCEVYHTLPLNDRGDGVITFESIKCWGKRTCSIQSIFNLSPTAMLSCVCITRVTHLVAMFMYLCMAIIPAAARTVQAGWAVMNVLAHSDLPPGPGQLTIGPDKVLSVGPHQCLSPGVHMTCAAFLGCILLASHPVLNPTNANCLS